jgi:hypothetical protein
LGGGNDFIQRLRAERRELRRGLWDPIAGMRKKTRAKAGVDTKSHAGGEDGEPTR